MSLGFVEVFQSTKTNFIFYTQIKTINSSCNEKSILCLASSLNGSDFFSIITCENCWSILQITKLNNPSLIKGIYWYLTINLSFGFSINSYYQNNCTSIENNYINSLCWHLIDDTLKRKNNLKYLIPNVLEGKIIKHIYLLSKTDTISSTKLISSTNGITRTSTIISSTNGITKTSTIISSTNRITSSLDCPFNR